MKIAVFSDSHGNLENMLTAAEKICPDCIIHLGDYAGDARELRRRTKLPVYFVRGNCDRITDGRSETIMQLEGKMLMLCHGHKYNVKNGYGELTSAAKSKCVDVALFGHTHRAWQERNGETLIFNPGTVSGRGETTCGVLEIKSGGFEYWFMQLENGEWTELR